MDVRSTLRAPTSAYQNGQKLSNLSRRNIIARSCSQVYLKVIASFAVFSRVDKNNVNISQFIIQYLIYQIFSVPRLRGAEVNEFFS